MINWDRYLISRSSNVDELRRETARVLSPHVLVVRNADLGQEGRLDRAAFGRVALVRLGYGVDVDVDPDRLESYYIVSLTAAGSASFHIGSSTVDMDRSAGHVISPTLRLKFRADRDYRQMMLLIQRDRLERFCVTFVGHALRCPVEFEPYLDLRGSNGQQWRHLFTSLTLCDQFLQTAQSNKLVATELEHLYISTLICTQKSTLSAEIASRKSPVSPYYVLRAEEYMRAHLDQPITLCLLAEVAGVSQRSLFEGFRKYRDVSPMAMLREMRLERVHDELTQPRSMQVTVTEVALSFGFTRLGSFAADYRRKFGELPSATLNAGKRQEAFDRWSAAAALTASPETEFPSWPLARSLRRGGKRLD